MQSEASEPEICAFGVWSVEQPVVDGRPLAMAADHADQWRRMRFDLPNGVHVQRMDFTDWIFSRAGTNGDSCS